MCNFNGLNAKRCLLTGYPGFLGSRMYQQLGENYEVHSLGLVVADTPNHLVVDLGQSVPEIADVKYDLVIHAAGKAHNVPKTNAEKMLFFQVNHQGTINLLRALDGLSRAPGAFVLISTVAVYGREEGHRISEVEDLKASDPYGKSKIMAEEVVMCWEQVETVKAVVRLPLIVGKNPPGNLGHMLNAIGRGTYFNIVGGRAKRSFVCIDDIAPFIYRLVTHGGIYNLTDGHDASFSELYKAICRVLHKRENPCLPRWVALAMARISDSIERITGKKMPFNSYRFKKMTSDLTFSCEKAINDFKWQPTKAINHIGNILP